MPEIVDTPQRTLFPSRARSAGRASATAWSCACNWARYLRGTSSATTCCGRWPSWLGGRILTNALVRDSIETTMLLGLFEAVPADVAVWRSLTPKDRWKRFNPGAVRDKLDGLKVWHRYDDYDLYSAMAGHPNPRSTRLSFSEDRERRMVGPFADAANAEGTLHAIALTASHGASWTRTPGR